MNWKVEPTNYERNALANGLALKSKVGASPFKFRVVGGEEYAHGGEHNLKSSTLEARLLRSNPGELSKIEQGTEGLSCVWASENTGESIFDAMNMMWHIPDRIEL